MATTVEGATQSETDVTDPARPNAVDDYRADRARPRPFTPQDERRELDHRLANSLQLAADFLLFEHMRISDPQARAALIATAERLSAVGQMHRFLAGQDRAGGIDLEAFLGELGGLIGESTGLVCDVDAEPIEVTGETAQFLAIAINELALNAAKHAYAWGERGPLHITCHRRPGGLALVVADEGQGLARDFAARRANRTGLGMTIVQAIVRQLDGHLQAVTDGGAKFTITIPVGERKPASTSRSFAPPGARD